VKPESPGDSVTKKRKIVYATLALAIACVAQALWSTLFNPLVWDLTYLGTHIARAMHQPDYDSAASARVFDALAILINALIYFAVLVAADRTLVRLRTKRA
jgi:dipeptide/tripeptide permease